MAVPPPTVAAPGLLCVRVDPGAPQIRPGQPERGWMDTTSERFAYRCTPLSIANSSGWEILCPFDFQVVWFGGAKASDLHVVAPGNESAAARLATSHFGHGVLTFHTGWLFRTPPGWAVWARGAPNTVKDGIVALDGLVETDWLPFPFTMNWRMTRPGKASFAKDEPFAFVTLTPHGQLDAVQPVIADLADMPELKRDYESWRDSRADFNARLASGDEAAREEGWQRNYLRGTPPDGGKEPDFHLSRRRLKVPIRFD